MAGAVPSSLSLSMLQEKVRCCFETAKQALFWFSLFRIDMMNCAYVVKKKGGGREGTGRQAGQLLHNHVPLESKEIPHCPATPCVSCPVFLAGEEPVCAIL